MKQFTIEKLDEGYIVTHDGKRKAFYYVEGVGECLLDDIVGTVEVTITPSSKEVIPQNKNDGWISVDEITPPIGVYVLCANQEKEETYLFPCTFVYDGTWGMYTRAGRILIEVTHWQPILKPPTK